MGNPAGPGHPRWLKGRRARRCWLRARRKCIPPPPFGLKGHVGAVARLGRNLVLGALVHDAESTLKRILNGTSGPGLTVDHNGRGHRGPIPPCGYQKSPVGPESLKRSLIDGSCGPRERPESLLRGSAASGCGSPLRPQSTPPRPGLIPGFLSTVH
jgi:hypothetical protein